jgi:hypothetical protein
LIDAGGWSGASRLDIVTYDLAPIGSYDVSAALANSGAVVEIASVPEPPGRVLAALGIMAGASCAIVRRARAGDGRPPA